MNLKINGYNIFIIVLITFIVSFLLSFVAKKIAVHVNALDMPNERKIHQKPMPRLGGLSIFITFIIGYMIYGTLSTQMLSVLISGFILIITGMIDDINPIKARYKFLAQIIAAVIAVCYGGLYFKNISLFGQIFRFPEWINMFLSGFFIVACINIINLIDGLDGLAGGISCIYFLSIAIIGFILNKFGGLDVVLSLIMLGSTLGFLIHNFPPAKLFMGDTGSMFLGFMMSVIALIGYKVTTVTSVIVPVIILSIPILDTLFAILRRVLKKEPISKPDKQHLHHQLLRMTSSPTKTVLLIYFINILFSATSILYVLGDKKQAMSLYIILMIFFLFLVLKTTVIFDHKKKK